MVSKAAISLGTRLPICFLRSPPLLPRRATHSVTSISLPQLKSPQVTRPKEYLPSLRLLGSQPQHLAKRLHLETFSALLQLRQSHQSPKSLLQRTCSELAQHSPLSQVYQLQSPPMTKPPRTISSLQSPLPSRHLPNLRMPTPSKTSSEVPQPLKHPDPRLRHPHPRIFSLQNSLQSKALPSPQKLNRSRIFLVVVLLPVRLHLRSPNKRVQPHRLQRICSLLNQRTSLLASRQTLRHSKIFSGLPPSHLRRLKIKHPQLKISSPPSQPQISPSPIICSRPSRQQGKPLRSQLMPIRLDL